MLKLGISGLQVADPRFWETLAEPSGRPSAEKHDEGAIPGVEQAVDMHPYRI